MREFDDHYEEEYLYLADVTHDAALIAWGKFFFNSKMKLVKDNKIHLLQGQLERHTSIGANCESYGNVVVEVLDKNNKVVQSEKTSKTFVWINELEADTEYSYRVFSQTSGGQLEPWHPGRLHNYHEDSKQLIETERSYDCRFRTFPALDAQEDLVFAVIGDTGTGTAAQYQTAQVLERLAAKRGVRFVLMTGDTIYSKSGGSGDDDFEWLTTYFQPYRTLIDHLPFYPCMGNHDTNEGFFTGEKQQDRLALYDNLLVLQRFHKPAMAGREGSVSPGLFYRFKFGANIEFICLDTSKEKTITNKRMFEYKHHQEWVQTVLSQPLGGAPKWRIPFSHHPPFCAGPQHDDDETNLKDDLLPLCAPNGIRTYLASHEHNFQCLDDSLDANQRVRCFVTGGSGGWRDKPLHKEADGYLQSWGGADRCHFLLVTIQGAQMSVEPIDYNGESLRLFNAQDQALHDLKIITVDL